MENGVNVTLADGSQTRSTHSTRIKVKIGNGLYVQVEYNIVKSLAYHIVFGMPFPRLLNPKIDWTGHVIRFGDGKSIQTVLVDLRDSRPSLCEILGKTAAQLACQQGSTAWFALVRGPQNIQTGLLASTLGTSDPIVAAPPQFQLLYTEYADVFAEPRKPALGQVMHRIDLLDESSVPPQ